MLPRCMFITITYKLGSKRLQVAGCVARDWQAYLRLLKSLEPQLAKMPWLKVTEKTKKGAPHHHLIVGVPDGYKIRCFGNSFDVLAFQRVFDTCQCVAHRAARVWKRVQEGESWIVHAIPVSGANGAASYLAKYMIKAEDREGLPLRRYSKSNNWPSEKRARLKHREWRRTTFGAGHVDIEALEPGMSLELNTLRMTERQAKARVKAAAWKLLKMGGQQ